MTINDIAAEITYTPLETHSNALLGGGNRMAVVDGDIYIDAGTSRSPIYRFDARGRFVRQMTRTGRGPGEYIMSLVWHANATRRTVVVADPVGYNLVTVSTDGGQPTGVKINNSDGFGWIPLNDGTFLVHKDLPRSRREGAKLSLRFFDANWKPTGTVERLSKYAPETPAMDISASFESAERNQTWSNFRGEALLLEAFNDTLFTVRSRSEPITPHLVLKRGRLAPASGDSGADKRRHIYIGYLHESGDHLYLTFKYDGKNYHDIWSKREGRLLIRRASKEGETSGFPLSLPGGGELYLNVAHADRDRFYFVMQSVDACRFLPGVKEDDNPVVVILKLK